MTRKLPFGTAQAEVLLKLTSEHWQEPTWSLPNGTALYESRALTDAVCRSLARHGLLDERTDGTHSVYAVNNAGYTRADQLRGCH